MKQPMKQWRAMKEDIETCRRQLSSKNQRIEIMEFFPVFVVQGNGRPLIVFSIKLHTHPHTTMFHTHYFCYKKLN